MRGRLLMKLGPVVDSRECSSVNDTLVCCPAVVRLSVAFFLVGSGGLCMTASAHDVVGVAALGGGSVEVRAWLFCP